MNKFFRDVFFLKITNFALNPFRKGIGIKLNNSIATALKEVGKIIEEANMALAKQIGPAKAAFIVCE